MAKNLRECWPRFQIQLWFTCLSGQELYKQTIPHIYQLNSCLQVDKTEIRQLNTYFCQSKIFTPKELNSILTNMFRMMYPWLKWKLQSNPWSKKAVLFYIVGRITKKDKTVLHITCVLLFISLLKSHISILWGRDHIIMHYYCLKIIPSSATLTGHSDLHTFKLKDILHQDWLPKVWLCGNVKYFHCGWWEKESHAGFKTTWR